MSTVPVIDLHGRQSQTRLVAVDVTDTPETEVEAIIRTAGNADIDAVHQLVLAHQADGRLLPRSRGEIASRIARFLVAVDRGRIVGCADLAPLSRHVAEVRSLVVDHGARSCGVGRRLVRELERRALVSGFESLTAFTHTPGYFVHLGFSIVPHTWVPQKIEADCRSCAQFRSCGQYAVMLPLIRTQTTGVPSHLPHA